LKNILNENKELQNIYLDFKRQILNKLIPDLPLYETRSAGEILEMIQYLKEKGDIYENKDEDFQKNGVFLIFSHFSSFSFHFM